MFSADGKWPDHERDQLVRWHDDCKAMKQSCEISGIRTNWYLAMRAIAEKVIFTHVAAHGPYGKLDLGARSRKKEEKR